MFKCYVRYPGKNTPKSDDDEATLGNKWVCAGQIRCLLPTSTGNTTELHKQIHLQIGNIWGSRKNPNSCMFKCYVRYPGRNTPKPDDDEAMLGNKWV